MLVSHIPDLPLAGGANIFHRLLNFMEPNIEHQTSRTFCSVNCSTEPFGSTLQILIKMLWYKTETHLLRLLELAQSTRLEQIVGIVLVTVLVTSVLRGNNRQRNIPNIPIHNASCLESKIVLQSRFVTGAKQIIASGYQKVNTSHLSNSLFPCP